MRNESADELIGIVPIGTTVVITKGPYTLFGNKSRIIIPGDRGSDVLAVQKMLKKLGYYKGSLDGYFGENLKYLLFKFQESKGMGAHNEITQKDLKLMGIFPFE